MTDKEYLTFLPHHMPVCFCLSVYSYLSFWLYEQVYLPARSARLVLFLQTLGGAPAAALQLCVNQATLQTASQAPHRVGSSSSPVSSCHPKFFSSPPLFLPQPFNHHHQLLSEKRFPLHFSSIAFICCTIHRYNTKTQLKSNNAEGHLWLCYRLNRLYMSYIYISI